MLNKSQTIYFIPGTMCDERLWTETWATIRGELPEHTTLEHINIPSLANIDDITQAVSEKLPLNSLLVGFSLGGYIASNIALKFPNKVAKLLLVSNMSSSLPDKETKERSRTIQWIKANGYSGIPEKRIHHLLHPANHDNHAIIQTIKDMDETLGKDVLVHQLNVTTQRENLLPQLFALKQQVNFLVGDHDKLVNIDRITTHLSSLPAKEKLSKHLDVIENTGHMLPLEQPQYLANVIKKLFTDIAE